MKLKQLIKKDVDIDICNDVTDSTFMALCGPITLTEEGEERYREILDRDVTVMKDIYGTVAIVHIDHEKTRIWSKREFLLNEFLDNAAGYCTEEEYNKYFKEEE